MMVGCKRTLKSLPCLFVLASALVAGCTSLQPVSAPQSTERERLSIDLLTMQDWSLTGRIAVKHAGGGGQGRIAWQQQGDTARISLSGPLGMGASEILWQPDEVSFSQGGEEFSEVYNGPDAAEQFLKARLGWSLPVSSIRYWIRGIPDPEFPFEESYDEQGGLMLIRQRGWIVNYNRYSDTAGWLLPSKLDVSNDSVRLRLLADEWNVPARDTQSGL